MFILWVSKDCLICLISVPSSACSSPSFLVNLIGENYYSGIQFHFATHQFSSPIKSLSTLCLTFACKMSDIALHHPYSTFLMPYKLSNRDACECAEQTPLRWLLQLLLVLKTAFLILVHPMLDSLQYLSLESGKPSAQGENRNLVQWHLAP